MKNLKKVLTGAAVTACVTCVPAIAKDIYLNNWFGSPDSWSQFEMTGNGLGWGKYNIGRNAAGKLPYDQNNTSGSWSSWNITINNADGVRTYCGNITYAFNTQDNLMEVSTNYEGGDTCYCDGFHSSTDAASGNVTVMCDSVIFPDS